jgi:hypothetical protein
MMPEQRQQNDDGKRDAEKPEENAATETHGTLQDCLRSLSTCADNVLD